MITARTIEHDIDLLRQENFAGRLLQCLDFLALPCEASLAAGATQQREILTINVGSDRC